MKIEVLGVGCPKCTKMFEATQKAVEWSGKDASVTKVFDLDEIARHGVISFPALVIDGEVRSVGRLLEPEEIARLLREV